MEKAAKVDYDGEGTQSTNVTRVKEHRIVEKDDNDTLARIRGIRGHILICYVTCYNAYG